MKQLTEGMEGPTVQCGACQGKRRIGDTTSLCRSCRGFGRIPVDLDTDAGRQRFRLECEEQLRDELWVEHLAHNDGLHPEAWDVTEAIDRIIDTTRALYGFECEKDSRRRWDHSTIRGIDHTRPGWEDQQ